MNSLVQTNNALALLSNESKYSKLDPSNYVFLLSSTHGKAHLGLVFNNYGFILPESITQSEFVKADVRKLYRTPLQNWLRATIYSDHPDPNRERRNEFKIIFAQSQKPISKGELEKKIERKQINKFELKETNHRLYACRVIGTEIIHVEELIDQLQNNELSKMQFIKEIGRRLAKEVRMKKLTANTNPFESLEMLTTAIDENYGGYEFHPEFESTYQFFGRVQKYGLNGEVPKQN